jgi:hypothetical protein
MVPPGVLLAHPAEGYRMSMVRRWLVVAAGLFAVAELIDGIVYRLPPGIVFGVVVGLCAAGLRPPRSGCWRRSNSFWLSSSTVAAKIRPPGGGWCCTACCRWPSRSCPGSISPAPCPAGDRDRKNVESDRCKVHQGAGLGAA